MATFKFLIQGKKNPTNIYVRLSLSKGKSIKRKTGYVINPSDWSTTGYPKQNDEDLKRFKSKLEQLKAQLGIKLNEAISAGNEIDGLWLEKSIDEVNNKKEKTDLDRLTNYCDYFIESLPDKVYKNGKHGVSESTIKKYTTIKNKLSAFENNQRKIFFVRDVNTRFRTDFMKYLEDVEKLSSNTVGRYIKFVKTVCLDARENEIETHKHLDKIKGFTEEKTFPYLSFEELDLIEKTPFTREALENAKDWLLIGCYIGQRVSDLLELKSSNIQDMGGFKMIVLTQKKTGKEVAIPIHDKIKPILEKRNWSFPESLSAVNFNLHIKDICKLAGIKGRMEGSKMVCLDEKAKPKVYRKIHGTYEKWELVSSHICRRSFATNFYADTPTALLINITAHSTEKQFLEYIGKPAKDFSVQLAEYWQKEAQKDKKEPQLTLMKEAN
ncbi:phage integrase SAM-like domain-containing protein [Maribellus mangrovi]|uniref:phage integrase SAM-like domain-containing protein n=1 Tax=Maribellus mangrovi TaxID=3133146 RepID=UPI0030EB1AD8